MNQTPKMVFSRTLTEPLAWQHSRLNRGDVAAEIPRLKRQPGGVIGVWGSVALVRSLLRLGLLDRLRLQWLGRPVPNQSPSQARAALVRRYLRLYGPSTVEDFAAWAGVAEPFARRAWSAVDDPLAEVDVAGRRCVVLAQDVRALTSSGAPRHGLRLLPPYEPYLQQRDRTIAVPDTALHKRIWRKTGNPGVVLRDGEVAALWRQRKQGRRLMLTIEPVTTLSTGDRTLIEAEAEPLAEFRGCATTEVGYDESR
jgi:Winged helix DNA-binding domain